MENTLMLKFELFRNAPDRWGWKLINYQPYPNQPLASSVQFYPTKEDCIEAIEHIKERIPGADIEEPEQNS